MIAAAGALVVVGAHAAVRNQPPLDTVASREIARAKGGAGGGLPLMETAGSNRLIEPDPAGRIARRPMIG